MGQERGKVSRLYGHTGNLRSVEPTAGSRCQWKSREAHHVKTVVRVWLVGFLAFYV